ncbi:MAG: SLC13 family permease [Acidobacteriota bacterium]|nr:SLC13 family permease [Acidobacteriota bacterium]
MPSASTRQPGAAWARRVGFWGGSLGAVALLVLGRGAGEQALVWRMAAVAVLMACWWVSEALPLAATGLVPVVAFPLLGIMPVADVSRQYGHHLILLFLAGFLLALALGRWELDRRLALSIVAVMGDRTRVIILGLMVATAWLSMWVSNSATAAMMMPVGLALTEHAASEVRGLQGVDVRPGRFRFGVAVMLGTAYAASIGGVGTLVGTPPNVLLAAVLEDLAGIHVGFGQWMLVGVPVVVLTLPVVWLWLVRVAYPPEVERLPGGRRLVREELSRLGAWTPGARRTAVISP